MVFGSSLASLVLAERLGSDAREVVLLNPGRSWGGIFSGLTIGSRVFDAGMTNFEFDLFGEQRDDVQAYDPDRRSDLAAYVGFVKAYVEKFTTVHPVPTPQMIWDGQRYRDMMITNEFDVLHALAPALRSRIRTELETIVRSPNSLHPRQKARPGSRLEHHSFEVVSKANHGETFHRTFIEPLFGKVLGVSSGEVPGPFHRSGWCPLFHPETLLSQFGPTPQLLKPTVFHYPDDAHFGAFILRIVESVRSMPNVRIVEAVTDIRVEYSNQRVRTAQGDFEFSDLAWGGDLRQLASLVANPAPSLSMPFPKYPRASLDLFFLQVKAEGLGRPFGVLIDPDPTSPFYRITDQTVCGLREEAIHRVVLESNAKVMDTSPDGKDAKIASVLMLHQIDPDAVVDMSHRHFADALPIPSLEQMRQFEATRQEVRSVAPGITLIGPSSGYVSVTLNDHVIQALKCAQQLGVST